MEKLHGPIRFTQFKTNSRSCLRLNRRNMKTKELKFLATPEKGEVSAILMRPDTATHLLVLGHGASTNMRHRTLEQIALALANQNIATFRYNFPYSESGHGRDS